jgi:hypothetical protein
MKRSIDIYKNFQGRWIKKANEYYVAKESLDNFINYLYELNVRILGVDGFYISDKVTKPDLEFCYDYSMDIPNIKVVKSDIKNGYKELTHFNFILENDAPDRFYFLCSKSSIINGVQQPDTLIRINTDKGNTYIAFSTRELAESVFEIFNLSEDIFIIKNDKLTKEIDYRLNPGSVLIFDNENEIKFYLSDKQKFPYFDYIVDYNHPTKSVWDKV